LELDSKISGDFSKSFDNIFFGNTITGYRNKNKFTFGYDISTINTNSSDLKDNSNVVLGFIGCSYNTSYVIKCNDACTINENFKLICKSIEDIIKKCSIKPFLQPPHERKNIKHNRNKHMGTWKYLTIRHSVYENKYMIILTNFIRHITSQNKSEYDEVVKIIRNTMMQFDFVRISEYN